MKRPTSVFPSRIGRGVIDVCDQDGYRITFIQTTDGVRSATANGTRVFVNYDTRTDIYECATGNAQKYSTVFH